jgi:hypothetical protein
MTEGVLIFCNFRLCSILHSVIILFSDIYVIFWSTGVKLRV